MNNNTIKVLRTSCEIVKREFGDKGYKSAAGINVTEWNKFTQEQPWTAVDKAQISDLLQKAVDTMAAHQGFVGFQLPAEYIAAIIAIFVDPINWRASAAHYVGKAKSAEQAVDGNHADPNTCEPLTASMMYNYILCAASENEGFDESGHKKLEKNILKKEAQNG